MANRQFAISGKWALAADRLQWMVQRQYLHRGEIKWQSVSFVASTKDVLARCLREKGCPPVDAERLLAGLWLGRPSKPPSSKTPAPARSPCAVSAPAPASPACAHPIRSTPRAAA